MVMLPFNPFPLGIIINLHCGIFEEQIGPRDGSASGIFITMIIQNKTCSHFFLEGSDHAKKENLVTY